MDDVITFTSMEDIKNHLSKAEGLTTNLYTIATKKLPKYIKMFNNSFCRSAYLLAKFNDIIYMNLQNKLTSQEWHLYISRLQKMEKNIKSLTDTLDETQKECLEFKRKQQRFKKAFSKQDHDKLVNALQKANDCATLKRRLEKEYNYDNSKKEQVLQQRQNALKLATDNYCNSLVLYSKYDLFVIYRLISYGLIIVLIWRLQKKLKNYFQ